jgi:hypothetical protein
LSAPSVPTQDQILERKASWRKGMLAMQSCPVLQKPTITGEDDRVQVSSRPAPMHAGSR